MSAKEAAMPVVAHYANFKVYLNDSILPLVQYFDYYVKDKDEFIEIELFLRNNDNIKELFQFKDVLRINNVTSTGQENPILSYQIWSVKILRFTVSVKNITPTIRVQLKGSLDHLPLFKED